MSDGTRRRVRLKLGMPSKNGTPQGSRSGSPEVPNATVAAPPTKPGKVDSRAGSPGICLLSFPLLSLNILISAISTAQTAHSRVLCVTETFEIPSLTIPSVSAAPEDPVPFPTGADIRAVVPATGLRMSELLAHFKGQINGDERKARFIKLMKENTRFEKVRKVLLPLEN